MGQGSYLNYIIRTQWATACSAQRNSGNVSEVDKLDGPGCEGSQGPECSWPTELAQG